MPTHDSLGMTRSRSSHSQQRLDDSDIPEIRVKTAYNGQVFITYIDHKITYPMLMTEMKDICGFAQDQVGCRNFSSYDDSWIQRSQFRI